MRQLIEALREIEGQNVNIYTEHKLFGKQHLKMKFKPETEIGFGFHYKKQIIYIDKNEIVDYHIDNDKVVINGTMMCINIIKTV